MIERAEEGTAPDTSGPPRRIDIDTVHARQIDHQTAVAHRLTGDVVTAATHGDQQILLTAEVNRSYDIGNPSTPDNQRRSVVDHPVPDHASAVVALVVRTEHIATDAPR
jgi:hypothetical protein